MSRQQMGFNSAFKGLIFTAINSVKPYLSNNAGNGRHFFKRDHKCLLNFQIFSNKPKTESEGEKVQGYSLGEQYAMGLQNDSFCQCCHYILLCIPSEQPQ